MTTVSIFHRIVGGTAIIAIAGVIGLFSLGFAPLVRAADGFVTGFVDLPLMSDMTESPDTTVSFDTTAGRIVIAFARTASKPGAIMAFYGTTLAQLGWGKRSEDAFAREGEVLTLDFLPDGPDTVVRFSLLPE